MCVISPKWSPTHSKAKNSMYQITLKSVLVIDYFVNNAILLYLSPLIKIETIEEKYLNVHTFFTCHVSMHGCCLSLAVLHWVVSRILADYFSGYIAHKTKQDSFNPLFKAVFFLIHCHGPGNLWICKTIPLNPRHQGLGYGIGRTDCTVTAIDRIKWCGGRHAWRRADLACLSGRDWSQTIYSDRAVTWRPSVVGKGADSRPPWTADTTRQGMRWHWGWGADQQPAGVVSPSCRPQTKAHHVHSLSSSCWQSFIHSRPQTKAHHIHSLSSSNKSTVRSFTLVVRQLLTTLISSRPQAKAHHIHSLSSSDKKLNRFIRYRPKATAHYIHSLSSSKNSACSFTLVKQKLSMFIHSRPKVRAYYIRSLGSSLWTSRV